MRRVLNIVLVIYLCSQTLFVNAQDNYWVIFKDKELSNFDPFEYHSQKSIERRIKNNITLVSYTDFPVNEKYIETISNDVIKTGEASRWLNALAVYASNEQIKKISQHDFVKEVRMMQTTSNSADLKHRKFNLKLNDDRLELLEEQISHMNDEAFINNNIDGKGVRIAIFDGGFPGVDSSPVFQHLRDSNRIVGTYDFIRNKENVYTGMLHGTMVLSCIGGKLGDKNMGLATNAEFLLARTEMPLETFKEEEYWLAAAEWADRNGADIINSSLGYTYHRYFEYNLDGQTSLISRAANIAASKGILVINAMGNDGDKKWQVMCVPADADSVLSVGAISPRTGYHISFSSFGPTADKRMKPNVTAFGETIASGKNRLKRVFGTSFSTPLVAGFAACAWQTRPDLTNMEIFKEIEKSGNLYPYYDYAHGYGIPDATYFINDEKLLEPTFTYSETNNILTIRINDCETDDNTDKVYYNFKNTEGIITRYAISVPENGKALEVLISDYKPGESLTVHYKGYTETYYF
jgi:subtilisin family serine protease